MKKKIQIRGCSGGKRFLPTDGLIKIYFQTLPRVQVSKVFQKFVQTLIANYYRNRRFSR